MSSFNEAALTLQKLRHGGKQVVVVQHVHVSDGGQAVIAGDMTTGGSPPVGGPPENGGTTPCDERSTPLGAPPAAAPRPAKRRSVSKRPCVANGVAACTAGPVPVVPEATSTP
jgi:hypothetical protein